MEFGVFLNMGATTPRNLPSYRSVGVTLDTLLDMRVDDS